MTDRPNVGVVPLEVPMSYDKLNLIRALTSKTGAVRAEGQVIHRDRGRRSARQGGQALRPHHHDLHNFPGACSGPVDGKPYSLIDVRIMPRSVAGWCDGGAETSSRGLRRVKSQYAKPSPETAPRKLRASFC